MAIHTELRAKGPYSLRLSCRMASDATAGRLYLAVIDPAAIAHRPRAKGFGDIWAMDIKDLGK